MSLTARAYKEMLKGKIYNEDIRQTAINLLDAMHQEISSANKKIQQIESSDLYTDKGKSEKIAEIKQKLSESLQGIRDRNKLSQQYRNEIAMQAAHLQKQLKYDPGKAAVYSEIRQRVLATATDDMLLEASLMHHASRGRTDVISAFLHDPLQETSRELLNKAVEALQPGTGNEDLEHAIHVINAVVDEHVVDPDDEITITATGDDQ